MDCRTSAELIDDFRGGVLDAETDALVREHLAACRNCRQMLSTEDLLARRLASAMRRASPSADFAARVSARLGERPTLARARRALFSWPVPVRVAAAVLLAACVTIALVVNIQSAKPPSDGPAYLDPNLVEPLPFNTHAVGRPFVIKDGRLLPYLGAKNVKIMVVKSGPIMIVEPFPEYD